MLYYSNKPESLGQLGTLGRQVVGGEDDGARIRVKFLRPYCVAYLDQTLLAHNKGSRSGRRVSSEYPEVNQYLRQTGFEFVTEGAKTSRAFPQRDIISVVRFSGKALDVQRVLVSWLDISVKPFLPRLTAKLWKQMVENLWEIAHNALFHGESEFGVSACGQFYPQMGYLEVAFYDAGYGIPSRVRGARMIDGTKPDSSCIEWAMQKGNSTNPLPQTGGLGLHLLQEFLKINGGTIQIVSGDGCFGQCGNDPPSICTLRNSIQGTLVNLRIIYDDSLYRLKGEAL